MILKDKKYKGVTYSLTYNAYNNSMYYQTKERTFSREQDVKRYITNLLKKEGK